MPHSSIFCRAAKQHWHRVGSDSFITKCSGGKQPESIRDPLPQAGGTRNAYKQETTRQDINTRGGVEDGSRPWKAAPVPTGDMQHHLMTIRGAVVCSWEVIDTDWADSAMGGGTGSCLREKEGEVCRPVHRAQRKWMECESVPSGGGSQRLCGQINIMPAKEPGTTGSHTEQIHERVLWGGGESKPLALAKTTKQGLGSNT